MAKAKLSSNLGAEWDWDLSQGATFQRFITVRDDDGVVVDITGWTFFAQIRKEGLNVTLTEELACSIVNAVGGEFKILLTDEQAAAITCGEFIDDDLSIYQSDGEAHKPDGTVIRLWQGQIRVRREVTREA